jgi:tetratricopeptide (TPR) repeat protein
LTPPLTVDMVNSDLYEQASRYTAMFAFHHLRLLAPILAAILMLAGCGGGKNLEVGPFEAGLAALNGDRISEAVDCFAATVQAEPRNGDAFYYLGVSHWLANEPDKAIAAFEKAVLLLPADSEPLEFIAHIIADRNQRAEAEHLLLRAVEGANPGPSAFTALAKLKMNAGEVEQARTRLRQALELDPDYPPALYNLAIIYYRWLGKPDDAAALLKRYLKLEEDNPHTEQARSILEAISKTENQKQQQMRERRMSAIEETKQGLEYYKERNWAKAKAFFEKAIASDDSYYVAHYNLGLTHMVRREWGAAIKSLRTSIAINPAKPEPRYMLARASFESGSAGNAIGELDSLLEIYPDFAKAHFLLGFIYSQDETRTESTRKSYRRYLALQKDGANSEIARKWLADRGSSDGS